MVLLSSPASRASQLNVTSLADSGPGSLRQAMQVARPGDTIVFGVTGTIALSSTLTISTNLTIHGPGTASLAISGAYNFGVLSVAQGVAAAISGVTIENGNYAISGSPTGGGGGISNSGTLLLNDCTLSRNQIVNGSGW